MQVNYQHRIFGLDLMRAIAILGVLASHVLWIFPDAGGPLVYLTKFGGVMGVEIFFVLSGFLIGRILLRIFTRPDFKMSHFKNFLIRRWFRTLPNYYLVLLLNIGLVLWIGRELPDTLRLYFGFAQNLYFGMDIFFTESWSLPIEEFAYVLGPLVLCVAVQIFAKARRIQLFFWSVVSILLVFLIAKIGYTLKLENYDLDHWNIHLKAVTIYRIDAIYYGVLAAFISQKSPKKWKQNAKLLAFSSVLIFLGFQMLLLKFQWSTESAPWIWNVAYLPFISVCIAMFLPLLSSWTTATKYLRNPVTHLSLISYAVYLLHYGIVLQFMRWKFPIEALSGNARIGYALLYIVITIGLSTVWYYLYEKPMMDLRDRPKFSQSNQR